MALVAGVGGSGAHTATRHDTSHDDDGFSSADMKTANLFYFHFILFFISLCSLLLLVSSPHPVSGWFSVFVFDLFIFIGHVATPFVLPRHDWNRGKKHLKKTHTEASTEHAPAMRGLIRKIGRTTTHCIEAIIIHVFHIPIGHVEYWRALLFLHFVLFVWFLFFISVLFELNSDCVLLWLRISTVKWTTVNHCHTTAHRHTHTHLLVFGSFWSFTVSKIAQINFSSLPFHGQSCNRCVATVPWST